MWLLGVPARFLGCVQSFFSCLLLTCRRSTGPLAGSRVTSEASVPAARVLLHIPIYHTFFNGNLGEGGHAKQLELTLQAPNAGRVQIEIHSRGVALEMDSRLVIIVSTRHKIQSSAIEEAHIDRIDLCAFGVSNFLSILSPRNT